MSVLPPAAFLDPKTNSGMVFLENKNNKPKEVTIDFKFGYLKYDENGNFSMEYNDKNAEKWSLLPYIRAFPKKMVIPPNGRQMIRFMVKATPSMPDGAYWVRLIVASKDARKQIDSATGTNVRVNLELAMSTSTIVILQKGKCNTGLEIKSHSFDINNEKLLLKLKMDKTGNTPFWGNVNLEVKDVFGNLVESKKQPLVVYFNSLVTLSLDRKKYTSGKYTLNLNIDNDRDEIPDEYRLSFSGISESYSFNVP